MRYNRLYKDNNYLTTTTYTQELSEYAVNLKYEDLPAEVVERAKMILMQTMGAALAARSTPVFEKALKMAREANGGAGGATTVWGAGEKLSAINAALVLGTAADILDWEDCSWTGHPSAGVIPCAWLAAEERHRSGKDLITAIVAGYEVAQRIAMAVQPSDTRWASKGWGLTSWQLFSCILPIAKLYGLDARRINQAIGMGCESSVLPTNYHAATMSDFGHYEYGYRARDGFMITKAAEKGIHNNRDALDEPRCYAGVVCGNDGSNGSGETLIRSKEADVTWLTRDLGKHYLILETLLKPWPTNLLVQAPLEVLKDLTQAHGFGPGDIASITVDPGVSDHMWAPEDGFVSAMQAQFSIPFALASWMYDPHPGAQWYADGRLKDPRILALAQRVQAGSSPELSLISGFRKFQEGGFPACSLTVTLKDGTAHTGSLDVLPGHPKNMVTLDAVADRFRTQAASALSGEALDEVLAALRGLEDVEDLASLSRKLS